ncbi:hypothetical protein RJ639_047733, partial [Escallonia herrerae]
MIGKLLIMVLKRGKAPIVVKSVVASLFIIMMYTVYTIRDIQCHLFDALNPTDHAFLANHMLKASLMDHLVEFKDGAWKFQAPPWCSKATPLHKGNLPSQENYGSCKGTEQSFLGWQEGKREDQSP